jgi:hypothetical protein
MKPQYLEWLFLTYGVILAAKAALFIYKRRPKIWQIGAGVFLLLVLPGWLVFDLQFRWEARLMREFPLGASRGQLFSVMGWPSVIANSPDERFERIDFGSMIHRNVLQGHPLFVAVVQRADNRVVEIDDAEYPEPAAHGRVLPGFEDVASKKFTW